MRAVWDGKQRVKLRRRRSRIKSLFDHGNSWGVGGGVSNGKLLLNILHTLKTPLGLLSLKQLNDIFLKSSICWIILRV